MKLRHLTRWVVAAALGGSALAVVPATSAVAADGNVVINEIYNNGGSAGSTHTNRYFELYNPGTEDVSLNGWSLQYKSATGATFSTVVPLGDKHIEPGGYFLIQGATNSTANPAPTPAFTADVVSGLNSAGGAGVVALSKSTSALTVPTSGSMVTDPNVVDLIGYGTTASVYEGASRAPGGSTTLSINRNASHADTNNNGADFATGAPTPQACGADCNGGGDLPPPVAKTIAEIQGPGAVSPIVGTNVTTTGVVTASYKTGGYNGVFIQTEGTSGPTGTTSNGLFVFSSALANASSIGSKVTVTGPVAEREGQTQIAASSYTVDGTATPIVAEQVTFPMTEVQKEARESMLVRPQGQFTITNNFTTNQYAEIGLAPGTKPFQNPTNAVAPGAPANALAAQNAADLITLDDAASINFFNAASQGTPVPWLTNNEVRVGQGVTFNDDVVLDWRNSLWKLQPTSQVLADSNGPITFGPTTRAAAPAPVGDGNLKIGTFNVLNYFPTVAEDWDALPGNVCTYYTDRAGVNVTANSCGNPAASSGNGPRGAANAASLARQQGKIVKAIETLDADVVSLEEIENSVQFGKNRDAALQTLVTALNADAGFDKWAAPTEPSQLPALQDQDVIRTAFIYQKANVQPVGEGHVLVGSSAFSNARQPYGQAFKPTGAADASAFLVVVNHFKSKGSGSGADADQNDGQGASNLSRKNQATALVAFADGLADDLGTERVFLTGDFNAYDKEDPIQIIENAGFVNVADELTDKDTYAFGGAVGSLDHVFASDSVFDDVTGADVWNINSFESVGREYSRWNYNVSPLVDLTSPYRASDHDPELVAFSVPTAAASSVQATAPTVKLGAEAKVEATVSPAEAATGGTVTVRNGDTTLGSGTVGDDGKVSISLGDDLAVGTYTLTVAFGGTDDLVASDTTASLTIDKVDSSIEATGPATADYAQDVTIGATVTGAAPTGTVTVTEGGTTYGTGAVGTDGTATVTVTDTLAPGRHTLTVTYGGDANNASSSDTVELVVGPSPASIDATAPSTIRVGQQATVSVVATGLAPTGTVTVSEGSAQLAAGQLVEGQVAIQVPGLTQGSHTLTVTYAGDANNAGSTDVVQVSVIRAKPELAATVAATPYGTGAKLQVTGAPGSTGALFVFDENGNGVGAGQLSNGAATLTLDRTIAVGTQTLSVAFTGNGSFDPGTASTSLTVTKATPTVTRASITSKIVVKKTKAVADIRVAATGYTVDGGTVGIYQGSILLGQGTVSNGRAVVTLRPLSTLGKRNITAKYLGNAQTSTGQVVFPITVVSK